MGKALTDLHRAGSKKRYGAKADNNTMATRGVQVRKQYKRIL